MGCGIRGMDGVFELLSTRGCATVATMPYRWDDFRSQPSERAFEEAANYRIGRTVYQLQSGGDIRNALQQRHPVVVAVAPDSTFSSGNFTIFTEEHQRQALARHSSGHNAREPTVRRHSAGGGQP